MWVTGTSKFGLRPLDQVLAGEPEAGLVEARRAAPRAGWKARTASSSASAGSRSMTAPDGLDPELLEHRAGSPRPGSGPRRGPRRDRRSGRRSAGSAARRRRRDRRPPRPARGPPRAACARRRPRSGRRARCRPRSSRPSWSGRRRDSRRVRRRSRTAPAVSVAGACRRPSPARARAPRPRAGPMIAWRAPGTPNSYGPPTTRGISSKLKIGGGEETCHSIVFARHGLRGRLRPPLPADDHVVEEDQLGDAEQERGDRDHQVPVAELGRVVGDAARHPLHPDPVHRDERAAASRPG